MAMIFAIMAFFYKPISKLRDLDSEIVSLVPKDEDADDSDDGEMATYPDSSDL